METKKKETKEEVKAGDFVEKLKGCQRSSIPPKNLLVSGDCVFSPFPTCPAIFDYSINLGDTVFEGDVDLGNCRFHRTFDFGSAVIKGNLILEDSKMPEVVVGGVRIEGRVFTSNRRLAELFCLAGFSVRMRLSDLPHP